MSILSKVLENLGLNYEQLSKEEKETFAQYEEALNQKELTLEDVKAFITKQKEFVIGQLRDYRNDKEKDLYLKARLRDLEMLEIFISTPEQNKKKIINDLKQRFKIK